MDITKLKKFNSQNKRKPQQMSTTAQDSLYSYTNRACVVLLEGIHKDQRNRTENFDSPI